MKRCSESLRRTVAVIGVLASGGFGSSMAAILHVPGDYSTLQAAVDAAASTGDEILIASGVYTQQVLITQKQLTLTGSTGTILQAWTGMKWAPPAPYYAVIDIKTNADVVVRNLEFDGGRLAADMPNRSAAFIAVVFTGTGGRVENCVIRGFRGVTNLGSVNPGTTIGGRGVGVCSANPEGASPGRKHVQILNNTFSDNGISILIPGAWDDSSLVRTTFIIEGNTITGVGPTTLDYQCGIVINPTAAGIIKANRIAGHYNENTSGRWSLGIIRSVGPPTVLPLRIEANTFIENEVHVLAVRADDAQIINNVFEGTGATLPSDGIWLTGSNVLTARNLFTNLSTGVHLAANNSHLDPGSGVAVNPSLLANQFCNFNSPVIMDPGVENPYELGSEYCPWPLEGFGNLICSPQCGLPGTTVTLSGTNLAGANAVLFNGLTAEFTPGTDPDKEIAATVPAHATTGPITVITPLGNITSLTPFTVPVPLTMSLQPGGLVQLSWCADACDLVLERASSLMTPDWQPVSTSPAVRAESVTWTGPLGSGAQFFRLRQPSGAPL